MSAAWLTTREKGTLAGIQLGLGLATLLGRRGMAPVVRLIALWYALFDHNAVRASRLWLERVNGRPAGFRDVYRHIRVFVQVTLDRVFLLQGKLSGLVFIRNGTEYLLRQRQSGRGAVLLGGHLGSYEAMRAGSATFDLPIQVLGYFENAKMINALFDRLNPRLAARVIHMGDDPVGVVARVRGRIEAGEFVGMLGDRVGLNDRVVRVPFLGQEAAFATGPLLLAALLRCPVYLVFGLYTRPNHYELHCEPFAERIELPRAQREHALRTWVERYAQRLEHYARRAPDNWFNWFDFWRAA